MPMPLLTVTNLTVNYGAKEILHKVSLTLAAGETLGIIGESGSGKTTLLRAIIGQLGYGGAVTEGFIQYKEQDLLSISAEHLRQLLGPEISMLFQDSQSSLCQIRQIKDLLYEAMCAHVPLPFAEAMARAEAIMRQIGLTDTARILASYPFELSGGMNQRVGLVFAMLLQPSLLLADEPTSALDVTVQKQVMQEMQLLQRMYHTAIIFATHNIALASKCTDKLLVLKDGVVRELGRTKEVFNHPQDSYTQELIAAVPRLRREHD